MNTGNDEQQLRKRFAELAVRADARSRPVWSDFLTIAEQDTLLKMKLPVSVSLRGGYDDAERRVACFGEISKGGENPLTCVRIAPVSNKFAEELSHRDVLGALMSLGLRREMLGDINPNGDEFCLFCIDTVVGYIVEQLERIKRTSVRCEVSDVPPEIISSTPEDKVFNVASERLDAILAAVYSLSRSESQELFVHQKVFVNGRMTENSSFFPKEGNIVSVRGLGRFVYKGVCGETKKGRLRITAGIYK